MKEANNIRSPKLLPLNHQCLVRWPTTTGWYNYGRWLDLTAEPIKPLAFGNKPIGEWGAWLILLAMDVADRRINECINVRVLVPEPCYQYNINSGALLETQLTPLAGCRLQDSMQSCINHGCGISQLYHHVEQSCLAQQPMPLVILGEVVSTQCTMAYHCKLLVHMSVLIYVCCVNVMQLYKMRR